MSSWGKGEEEKNVAKEEDGGKIWHGDEEEKVEKVEKEEEDDVSESLPPITCACTV